jgi:hypothetical protein
VQQQQQQQQPCDPLLQPSEDPAPWQRARTGRRNTSRRASASNADGSASSASMSSDTTTPNRRPLSWRALNHGGGV